MNDYSAGVRRSAVLNVIRQISRIALPLITFPYVTRVLTSENYGKVGFCESIISYFVLAASLGIGNYAVREGVSQREDREKTERFSNQILSINLLSTLIAYSALGVFLFFWNGEAEYKRLLLIQCVQILFATVGIDWLFSIYEDYLYITVRSVLIQAASVAAVFLLIKKPEDFYLYSIISVGSSVLSNLVNLFYSRKYVRLRPVRDLELSRHLKPVLILFANVALVQVYLNSDLTMIGFMLGDTEVGEYRVSVQIYSLVKTLVNAIIAVIVPRLAKYAQDKSADAFRSVSVRAFKAVTVFLMPVIVGLFMVSKNAVLIAGGEEYLAGVPALRILCGALLFAVPANFFINGIMLTKKMDGRILAAAVVSAAANVLLNFFFIPFFGIIGAAVTTLISEGTVMVIGLCSSAGYLRGTGYARTLITAGTGCMLIVGVCLGVGALGLGLFADTALKIVVSTAVYTAALLVGLGKRRIFGTAD